MKSRATREAITAVAIIGITIPEPLVISMTITNEVIGDCVTAARYPVMQSAMTAAIEVQESSWFSCREGYEAIAANYASRLKKSLKQARKRLGAGYGVEFLRSAGDGIAEAFTQFLEVEASGWKAEQGSAIGQVADRRAFYELLIRGGNGLWRPEINLLRLNGRTAAAQLCVRAGRALSVLKIGYDESHRELTPGNLLLDQLLRTSCESGDTDTVSLITDTAWMADWRPRKAAVLTLMRFNHTAAGLTARALSHVGRLRDRMRNASTSAPSPATATGPRARSTLRRSGTAPPSKA